MNATKTVRNKISKKLKTKLSKSQINLPEDMEDFVDGLTDYITEAHSEEIETREQLQEEKEYFCSSESSANFTTEEQEKLFEVVSEVFEEVYC